MIISSFKNLDGKYLTLKDCIEENKKETENKSRLKRRRQRKLVLKDARKEPEKTVIYYVTDEFSRASTLTCSVKQVKDAVILKHNIDSQFISHLEQQDQTIQLRELMQI